MEHWQNLPLCLVRQIFYQLLDWKLFNLLIFRIFKLFYTTVGALHSTSQIAGLLSWLCDFVRAITFDEQDGSLEKVIHSVLY